MKKYPYFNIIVNTQSRHHHCFPLIGLSFYYPFINSSHCRMYFLVHNICLKPFSGFLLLGRCKTMSTHQLVRSSMTRPSTTTILWILAILLQLFLHDLVIQCHSQNVIFRVVKTEDISCLCLSDIAKSPPASWNTMLFLYLLLDHLVIFQYSCSWIKFSLTPPWIISFFLTTFCTCLPAINRFL